MVKMVSKINDTRGHDLAGDTRSGGEVSFSSRVGYRHEVSPDEWLHETASRTVAALARRVELFKSGALETPLPDSRFKLLERMIPSQEELARSPGRSALERVVRGYLTEFVRQTIDDVPPCNVVSTHVDRSQHATLWNGRSASEFWVAASPGVFHSAVVNNYLRSVAHQISNESGLRLASKDAWGVLVEIVKASVVQFKEDCHEILPGVPPRASVFNDHTRILRYGAALDINRLRPRRRA